MERLNNRTYTSDSAVPGFLDTVFVGGGSATTLSLPDPSNVASQNGHRLLILPITEQAHVISNVGGSGFNNAGSGADTITFDGSDSAEFVELVAVRGYWRVIGSDGITLG